MTKFRRRLLMSAVSDSPQPDRSNLVTWEKLFSVLPKGVFIRIFDGEFRLFKDYAASSSYLTWGQLYKILEPGIYFTVEGDYIETHYDVTSGTPHLDAYVTYGDLRSIFPQGFTVVTEDDNLYVAYDESLVTDEDEDLNRIATPIDLYMIIPHGVEFFLIGGELVVRNLGLNNPNAIDLADLSDCDDLPNVYYGANSNMYPSLRNLYELIPSGVYVSEDGTLAYDELLDYCDDTPLTFNDFFSIVEPSFKVTINNGELSVSTFETTVDDMETNITWADVWNILPNGVHVAQNSNGEYYLRYRTDRILSGDMSTNTVTRRELSRIIPFGLIITYDEQVMCEEYLDHIIWYNRFDNPFTTDVLQSIITGHKFEVNDYTGQVTIS